MRGKRQGYTTRNATIAVTSRGTKGVGDNKENCELLGHGGIGTAPRWRLIVPRGGKAQASSRQPRRTRRAISRHQTHREGQQPQKHGQTTAQRCRPDLLQGEGDDALQSEWAGNALGSKNGCSAAPGAPKNSGPGPGPELMPSWLLHMGVRRGCVRVVSGLVALGCIRIEPEPGICIA